MLWLTPSSQAISFPLRPSAASSTTRRSLSVSDGGAAVGEWGFRSTTYRAPTVWTSQIRSQILPANTALPGTACRPSATSRATISASSLAAAALSPRPDSTGCRLACVGDISEFASLISRCTSRQGHTQKSSPPPLIVALRRDMHHESKWSASIAPGACRSPANTPLSSTRKP